MAECFPAMSLLVRPRLRRVNNRTRRGVTAPKRVLALAAMALSLGACSSGGSEKPHVTFNVSLSGDLASLRPADDTSEPSLRVALVWGAQWSTDPFCVLPPESDAVTGVIAAGCRDPFSFVPGVVAASAPIAASSNTTLTVSQLPPADLLIGDTTARIAYGSLVIYDDRDRSGTLELSQPHPAPAGPGIVSRGPVPDPADVIYGASFVTMTEPDQRVAYREGGFDGTGTFYPRAGCPAPPVGFSIVGAGGFTSTAAMKATLTGTLPQEDPATCLEGSVGATVVAIAARAVLDEVGCAELAYSGRSRYLEPPVQQPDFTGRVIACAQLPEADLSGASTDGGVRIGPLLQLVVSGRSTDRCKGLTHYSLRGCRESVSCAFPDWDFTANPMGWWPCQH
jgi:hypothetical protein